MTTEGSGKSLDDLIPAPQGDDRRDPVPSGDDEQAPSRLTRAQWILAFGILAYGIGAAAFWILSFHARADTAALYVGIPTVLSFLLATAPRSRSRTGAILKSMTIALALVGITLGPGIVCIVISAPLFFGIGAIVGMILDARSTPTERNVRLGVVTVVLAISSLEGVHPALTASPWDQVTVNRILPMSAEEFRSRLAKTPGLNQPLPFPINLGLPAPVRANGSGLEIGARRSVFLEDRNIYPTLVGKSGRKDGDLVFEVITSNRNDVRFVLVSDDSHVAKWLTWRSSHVSWSEWPAGPRSPARVYVTWTVSYERRLAPSWYFGPILHYAVGKATGLALDIVAAQND
jgi:hypothetical protein